MNKLILLFFFTLSVGCGYSSLNKVNQDNFIIVSYNLKGDDKINKYFVRNFERFEDSPNAKKKFKINLESKLEKNITSKNSAGVTNSFNMEIIVDIEIIENNISIEKDTLSVTSDYNNLNSKFELKQYENILIKDLTNQLNYTINSKLSQLNDS